MAGIFASRITASAFDAGILIDPGFGHIVKVKVLPIHHLGHRGTYKVINGRVSLFIHPVGEAGNHFLNDLEPIRHGGCTDLHICCAKCHEFSRVPPRCHAAYTRNWNIGCFTVAGNLGHHIHSDRFDRRSTVSSVGPLSIYGRRGGHDVEIYTGD